MNTKSKEELTHGAVPEAPKLQLVLKVPERITDGKDELNFAEFPLSALTDRPDPKIKTIVFEDQIFDQSKNQQIARSVTISGSDAFGLPTPADEEVLLALIQLSKIQNFQSKRVYFTRFQLIQILNWKRTGQMYARLDLALKRWMGVTMYYKNAWRDKAEKSWMSSSFHMLESVHIVDGKSKPEGEGSNVSYFEWNEVVFRSFQNGNVKALNYDFFLSIESPIAKRLYRFLDKRFFFKNELEFDLTTLAFEHVGLSRNTPTGDLKRKINGAIDELVEKQFLESIPKEERFWKLAPGVWKVIFRKRDGDEALLSNSSNGETIQKLVAFGLRAKKALEIIEKYPEELVLKKLQIADWMMLKKDSRVLHNPAGFLVASIEKEYEAPKEFVKKEALKGRQERLELKGKEIAASKLEVEKVIESAEAKTALRAKEFWDSLTEAERVEHQKRAFECAPVSKRKFLEGGGKLAEVTRGLILESYALEAIAEG
jgi:hypothetical protein